MIDIAGLKVLYRLEVGAGCGAEGARRRWDDQNAFGAVVEEDIITNVTSVVDGMDATAVLVGYQDLAAIWAEA